MNIFEYLLITSLLAGSGTLPELDTNTTQGDEMIFHPQSKQATHQINHGGRSILICG